MDVRLVAGALKRCSLFESFDAQALGKLAQMIEVKSFDPKAVLYRPSDDGSSLFVLTSGQVEFFVVAAEAVRVVATIGPVRSFGEISMLLPGKRMIGARAVEEVTVFELSSGLLKMLELSDPTLALELIAAVRERVMELFAPLRPMLAQVFVQALENIDTNELSIGPVRR